jgi:hypothetical protein
MDAVVFQHVRVAELPDAWRDKLARPANARVTVRIEDESGQDAVPVATDQQSSDPAFGIWRDRTDMTDVSAYLRQVRAVRVGLTGFGKPV